MISDVPGGIEVVIPAPRKLSYVIGGAIFFAVWLLMVVRVAWVIRPMISYGMSWFPVIWLMAVGLLGAYAFLWRIWGREILSIRDGCLKLRAELFGVGPTREFSLNQVRQFGCRPSLYSAWSFRQCGPQRGAMTGRIAFESGSKSYAFGAGLSEPEAEELAAEVGRRFQLPA